MRAFYSVFLFFVSLGSAVPAWADESITVLVRVDSGADVSSGDIAAAIVERLNQTKGVLALRPELPVSKEAIDAAVVKSSSLLSDAEDRYRKFDSEGALVKLKQGRAALVDGCGGADRKLLRSMMLLEALVQFTSGKREAARAVFDQLAALDLDWTPGATDMAPKIRALYTEARDAASKSEPGQVVIDSVPSTGKVLIDGGLERDLPAVIEKVAPGEHCVVVQASGYGVWSRKLTVSARGAVRLRAVLFPILAGDYLTPNHYPGDERDAGDLARTFGADFLVLSDVSRKGISARLVSASTGRISKLLECSYSKSVLDGLPCLVDGLLAAREDVSKQKLITKVDSAPPKNQKPIVEKDLPPKRVVLDTDDLEPIAWYKRWWVWTLVGCVVTGATVGLVLGLPSNSDSAGYRVVVTRP